MVKGMWLVFGHDVWRNFFITQQHEAAALMADSSLLLAVRPFQQGSLNHKPCPKPQEGEP